MKAIEFLTKSNRWKHLLGGVILGIGTNDWYCAEYTGVAVAGALELKDKLHDNEWDWIDFVLTLVGVNLGYLVRLIIV